MAQRTRELLDVILVHDDPVARNRLITQCYRDIADQLALVVGRRDLNWFSFGAWASGTAGAAIRGERIPVDFGTSRNVAAGNLAIIADVAPAAICWLDEIERAGGPTPDALSRTLADPLFGRAPKLAEAIRCYHEAALLLPGIEADPVHDKTAAELILLGNIRMGEHEQTVVDRFVDAAMPLGGPFGLITTRFIAIETPDGDIDVCRDVLAPAYLAGQIFPAVLLELDNVDLRSACDAFGQSRGTDTSASNALRWEDYDDRMGFILTFFRAYQRDTRFFDVPARYLPALLDGAA
ncbi:hypothetical protein ACH3VR_16935 [Microbacterium sp. B2969]|uniref:Uncharacterized protein n=1 Tax=Microbacterium alkaliflavum TaxID=3248839 RepID=A0ABW7QCW4_9MICO